MRNDKMSNTPISRDSMRILHEQTLEEQRKSLIKQTVSKIYFYAVNTAKAGTDSKYLYEVFSNDEHCRTNMSDILAEVQSLFPDCSVKHTLMSRTHDISKIDEHLKPLIMNQAQSKEYIVVDWS
jgi:hypothetical protein